LALIGWKVTTDVERKRHRLLHEILPYRMMSVDTLRRALHWQAEWPDPTPMQIYADGKVIADGNLNGFLNPAIEAGLVHCRALLEFLGLKAGGGHIVNVKKRRSGDIGVEHFSNASGRLPKVSPGDAFARYPGGREDAEKAFLAVFEITNKGIAHVTEDLRDYPDHGRLVEIASLGVPSLVISYLYTPLGLPAPEYQVTHRTRNGSEA
jgi:hypothetical protein